MDHNPASIPGAATGARRIRTVFLLGRLVFQTFGCNTKRRRKLILEDKSFHSIPSIFNFACTGSHPQRLRAKRHLLSSWTWGLRQHRGRHPPR